MRVFNESPKWYYNIVKPQNSFDDIMSRSQEHSKIDSSIKVESFKSVCMELQEKVMSEPQLRGLFNGVHVPFICPQSESEYDLGLEHEKITLILRDILFSYACSYF